MANTFSRSFLFSVMLFAWISASRADQVVTSATVAPQLIITNRVSQNLPAFSVHQFSAALGTLTSVVLDVQPVLTGSGIFIDNFNLPVGTVVQAGYTNFGSGGVNGYTGSVTVASIPGLSGAWSTGADLETITLTNHSSSIAKYILQGLPAPGPGPQITLSGADLAPFVGEGTLSLAASVYADYRTAINKSAGLALTSPYALAGASLGIIYNYTAIPEPTTVSLVVFSGLTALFVRRRSRK